MKFSKKFVIFCLLSLLTISGCSFNYATKTEKKFKTYCSADLGIEFKYPDGWRLGKDGSIFYLREDGNPGNILMMRSGGFSELENEDIKKDDHIVDSKIIEINGTKVIERNFKPIEPKNMAAIKGYYFLAPTDRWVAVMNNFSDRNSDIFEEIVKSVKIVNDNGCSQGDGDAEKVATTTIDGDVDNNSYSLEIDKSTGWHIFKDKINGFLIKYVDPLVYVEHAGGDIKFQIQFPYEGDGREVADIAKMNIRQFSSSADKSVELYAKETAKAEGNVEIYDCTVGDKKAICLNPKIFFNDIEIKNYYSKTIFLENKGAIYGIHFFSSGNIKNKFKDIFNQIENKIEFIK